MARITKAQIEARASDYESAESRFRAECRIDQDYLHATDEWRESLLAAYIKGFPKGFRVKALPLARMAVETFKNTIIAGEVPDVKDSLDLPEEEEPSEAQKAKLEETERFHKAFLWELANRTSNNPFAELVRKQAALGPGILSFPWDESLWPEEPKGADAEAWAEYEVKRDNAWPWRIGIVHPFNILPDPYNNPPRDYVIKDKISYRVAAEQYPQLGFDSFQQGEVDRLIYCSEDDYAVYLNDLRLFGDVGDEGVVDNPMGMLWYELALSGLGEEDEAGNVVHLWQGAIRGLRDIIAIIITNYNVQEALKWQESFGPRLLEGPSLAEAEELAKKIVLNPLEIVAAGSGYKMSNLIEPTNKQGVIWEQDELNRWLEIMMGPLSGNFRGNETTASGLAQRVSLQELPYLAAKVSAEQAIANMLRKVTIFYKERIGKKFGLRRDGRLQHFNPENFLTDLHTEVNLKPVTAADRAMAIDQDLKELGDDLISPDEYRRRHAIKNGMQMDKESALKALKMHPAVIDAGAQVIVQLVMQKYMPAASTTAPAAPAGEPATETFTPNPTQNGQAAGNVTGSLMGAFANTPIPAGPGV